jgi:hypothetical protein
VVIARIVVPAATVAVVMTVDRAVMVAEDAAKVVETVDRAVMVGIALLALKAAAIQISFRRS